MVERGAARFDLDATQQRAGEGELFVLEPEAVHTGMAAVPEGWAYKVLYIEPRLVHDWAERDGCAPRAARWVVFRDRALRSALEHAHAALAAEPAGDLAVDEAVLQQSPRFVPICSRDRRRTNAIGPSMRRSAGPGATCPSAGTSGSRWPSSPPPPGSAGSSWSGGSASRTASPRTRFRATSASTTPAACSPPVRRRPPSPPRADSPTSRT